MIALLRAETLKLRSTRTTLGLLIAASILTALPAILILILAPANDLAGRDGLRGVGVGADMVALVTLVFGIIGMTGEYRHGTISYTFLQSPNRALVMVLKLVVYTAAGIAIAVFAQALVQVIVAIGFPIRGIPSAWPDWHQVAFEARIVVFTGLITAFGVALGALIRNQVVAIAGTVVWWLFVEPIITAIRFGVGHWLPFQIFTRIVSEADNGASAGPLAAHPVSVPEAVVIGLIYIAAVSVAATLITLRRDVT